jgi:GxxExxY protein
LFFRYTFQTRSSRQTTAILAIVSGRQRRKNCQHRNDLRRNTRQTNRNVSCCSCGHDFHRHRISGGLKLDLLVEDCVVVELKAVECLHPVHQAQVITYLKLTGYLAGLLMNFDSTTLIAGLKRVDHPDRYVKKTS